jgi:hypothetical protein
VIDCFDGPRPQSRCLLGTGPCDSAAPCAAHRVWTAVGAARRAPLTATTLADLVPGPVPGPAPGDSPTEPRDEDAAPGLLPPSLVDVSGPPA